MLTAALLVFLAQAEPPWDEALALTVRQQLAEHPLPGLTRLQYSAGSGWRVELDAQGTQLVCAREKNLELVCRPPRGAVDVALSRYADAWVGPLGSPFHRWAELSVAGVTPGQPFATLAQSDGERRSFRLLSASEQWQLSEPICDPAHGIDAAELAAAPMPVPGGRLAVMRYDEGGNGNNASGTVAFRGFILRDGDDPTRLLVGDGIDLGGGSWGRFVGDDGFHLSSAANILCARPWVAGFELFEACPSSVDPRGFASYGQWCEHPCAKGKLAARTGHYLVRGGRLLQAHAAAIRAPRPGELRLLEVPEPGTSSGLGWVELRNESNALLDLRGLSFANTVEGAEVSPVNLINEPSCVIDAKETVLLEDRRGETDAGVHFCPLDGESGPDVTQPIDLYLASPDGARRPRIGRASTPFDGGSYWDGERPRRSWQLDGRGKWCLAPGTPGAPNPRCP